MMPAGRGSSGGSASLAEALRLGAGPAAILLLERDAIVIVGAIVAAELYGRECPVVLASKGDWEALAAAARLVVSGRAERRRDQRGASRLLTRAAPCGSRADDGPAAVWRRRADRRCGRRDAASDAGAREPARTLPHARPCGRQARASGQRRRGGRSSANGAASDVRWRARGHAPRGRRARSPGPRFPPAPCGRYDGRRSRPPLEARN